MIRNLYRRLLAFLAYGPDGQLAAATLARAHLEAAQARFLIDGPDAWVPDGPERPVSSIRRLCDPS